MSSQPAITIRTLRAPAADDPLRARLRLAHTLGMADLRPPGLPHAAILCVRRLHDPLPGGVGLDGSAPPEAWQEAVRRALAHLAAAAARPAAGPVHAGAPAVLFADRVELLVCLARDTCAHTLAERWWWRLILGSALASPASAWRETPAATPAALAQLGPADAARFLAALPDTEVAALTAGLAAAFGLPASAGAPAHPRPGPLAEAAARRPPAPIPALAALAAAPALLALDALRRWLLGLGALLAYSPFGVCEGTLTNLVIWTYTPPGPAQRQHTPEGPPGAATGQRAPEGGPDAAAPPRTAQGRPAVKSPPRPAPRSAARGIADIPTASPAPEPHVAASPQAEAPLPPVAQEQARNQLAAPGLPGAARKTAPTRHIAPEPMSASTVCDTRLGGVCFLINLTLALGLYGDFTQPLSAGLRLSPWDLLALLGRRLLPDAPADDPLWALLARLAGRTSGAPPGAGFTPPRVRGRPPAARRGRVRLTYGRRFRPRAGLRAARLARWADRLACAARARLLRARGDEATLARALSLPARIAAGLARVDVFYSLAELPVEVRLAGLDRDPGWVPAAGRDIRFHFE
jgi:hypothetical protein